MLTYTLLRTVCSISFTAAGPRKKRCDACSSEPNICLCGCGSFVKMRSKSYKQGHHPNTAKQKKGRIINLQGLTCKACLSPFEGRAKNIKYCNHCIEPRLCACGCGRQLITPGKRWAKGHNPSTKQTKKLLYERTISCKACGIEALTTKKRKLYCSSCSSRMLDKFCASCSESFLAKNKFEKYCTRCRTFCSCGCGNIITTPYTRDPRCIKGHHVFTHSVKCKSCEKEFKASNTLARYCVPCCTAKLCLCGCGTTVKLPYSKYAVGHAPFQRVSSIEYLVFEKLKNMEFLHASASGLKGIPLHADIVHEKSKLLVQIDGCHWHECPLHGRGRFPNKAANDKRLDALAVKAGWFVLRIWEHEILSNIDGAISRIITTKDKLLETKVPL